MPIKKITTSKIPISKADYKENILSDTVKKQAQHELSNYAKRAGRESFGKGAEIANTLIVGNMIVFSIFNFKTTYEKNAIKATGENLGLFLQARQEANDKLIEDHQEEFSALIDKMFGARVLGHFYDQLMEDDYCLWVVILDTYLTI